MREEGGRGSGGDLALSEWNAIPQDTETFPKPDLLLQFTTSAGPEKASCCPLHLRLCVDTLIPNLLLPPRRGKHSELRGDPQEKH